MSHAPIHRPSLTAYVVEVAKGSSVPIGRGSAPREGGWYGGQQGSGDFTDYVVVKAGPAQTPARGEYERLGRFATSWDVRIQIIGHGETEQRCDEAASTVLKEVFTIDGDVTLEGVAWTIQKVVVNTMNATEWSNQDKAWRTLYDVSLHLSRQQPG